MKNIKQRNNVMSGRVSPARGIGWRIYEDEVLIMRIPFPPYQKTRIYQLRELERDIWKIVKGKRTMEEIVGHIAKKKGVQAKLVENEIVAFIVGMKSKGLVDITYET